MITGTYYVKQLYTGENMDYKEELKELRNRIEYDLDEASECLEQILPMFMAYSKKFVELQYKINGLTDQLNDLKKKMGDQNE